MIPIENNSWDYVQRLIEREIVVKVNDANGAHHGVDYEEMRIAILNSLFHPQPQTTAYSHERLKSPMKK